MALYTSRIISHIQAKHVNKVPTLINHRHQVLIQLRRLIKESLLILDVNFLMLEYCVPDRTFLISTDITVREKVNETLLKIAGGLSTL